MMVVLSRVVLTAVLLAAGCVATRPGAVPRAPGPRPFIITFWCGPPLDEFTDARAAEIAAAGFTTAGPPCEGDTALEANRRALEVAERHGLRLWVKDPRFGTFARLAPDWESRIDAAVADYSGYPSLDGYFVMDEPSAAQFDTIAPVVQRLRSADPGRIAYVNLLPDFVSPDGLGTDTYTEYVEGFITTVRPQLLSYDYYPFEEEKDRTSFFDNLATIRRLALRHHLPFMLIVQAMPHGTYRDPTEAELAWQIFHALAFGARGVSYFAYWTPVETQGAERWNFRYGLVEKGTPTRHYFEAMRLNRKVKALAEQLAGWESVAIADSVGEIGASFPLGPIAGIDGGEITAGLFVDQLGRVAALLVNRDYRYGARIRVRLRAGAPPPECFGVARRQWALLSELTLTLAPGDAKLLRWYAGGVS